MIIGAQRAGTTSLYRYLATHRCIVPTYGKEVHFFDLNYYRGDRWYRSHFPLRVLERYASRAADGPRVVMEASPYYLFHPHAPPRAAEMVPFARIIALLRNPADRAISQYHHEVRHGCEHLSFEDAIAQEEARLAGEVEKLLNEPDYYSWEHQHHSYLSRGVYVDQLHRWAHFFPREQMLVLKAEDLFDHPPRVLYRVLEFLGLPRDGLPERYLQHNAQQYDVLSPDTRQWLREYFRPHNQRLYAYLGVDFGWDA